MSSKLPPTSPAPARRLNAEQKHARTAGAWNSSYDPSSGSDKVHKLARAFGKAKSRSYRDDAEAARIGRELGECILVMRTTLGYTRGEMASEVDVLPSVFKLIETGELVPSISILYRAFSFLGIDILPHILYEI